MKSKRAHNRLKKLRRTIGLTQMKLAKRCGVSYPYLLSVETGQRTLSENLATKIGCATGISVAWLCGHWGSDETPLDPQGNPYNEKTWESFQRWSSTPFPSDDFGDVGDEAMEADDCIDQIGVILRAAWRAGKFRVALYQFRDLLEKMERDLDLKEMRIAERRNDIPVVVFDGSRELESVDHPIEVFRLFQYLSPTARYWWGKAYEHCGSREAEFMKNMDQLRDLIEESFTLR